MINLKIVEIENNSSFLNIYKFDDTNLLESAINYLKKH